MRVIAYYYLAYPDDSPLDPAFAATEMYVELGEEGDTIRHHQGTYAFQVYTFRYVQQEFIDKGEPLVGKSIMIVPTLADNWMLGYLERNSESLARWGEVR